MSATSPTYDQVDSSLSPASSMLSPEHLYHQLAELDGVDHQGLQDGAWDMEDLQSMGLEGSVDSLELTGSLSSLETGGASLPPTLAMSLGPRAMPDVLHGVVGRGGSPEYAASQASLDSAGLPPGCPPPSNVLPPGCPPPSSPPAAYPVLEPAPAPAARSSEAYGSGYLAESVSLASSDLVDLSPMHSTGLVESASQLSWSEVDGLTQPWEEEPGEQEVARRSWQVEEQEEHKVAPGGARRWQVEEPGEQEVARRSSTSSLNRVSLTRTRLCHNSMAVAVPGFMVLPKEEEVTGNGHIDLRERIDSVQENRVPNEYETSDMSDSDVDSKVLEMTKRFGGARKSVNQKIQKIRSNLPMGKPKARACPEPVVENSPPLELRRGERGDCKPVIVFLSTPLLVLLLAALLNWWWNLGSDGASLSSIEE